MPSWIASALSTLSVQERAVYLASTAAVILAWVITRRKAEHRTVVVLLSIGLGCDVVQRALRFAVLAPAHLRFGRAPLEGWALVVGQLSQALFLAWPAALVASARVSFDVSGASTRRSLLLIGVVWAAVSAALALIYPITRGPVLARCYLAVELVALLVTAVTIGRWVRERRTPELHHLSIALVATAELCTLVGPWRYDLFGSWPLAQSIYLTLFGVLVVLQGGSLWLSRGSSR